MYFWYIVAIYVFTFVFELSLYHLICTFSGSYIPQILMPIFYIWGAFFRDIDTYIPDVFLKYIILSEFYVISKSW